MGSTLSEKVINFVKWFWYQLTKGLYRHEFQLLVAPFFLVIIQESFNSLYPKIPAYIKQPSAPENELQTLLDFTLLVIYYSTMLFQIIVIIGWVLLPGYFCYNLRYRNQLRHQMSISGDFWLKSVVMKAWRGKYQVFVKLLSIMLFFIVVNVTCMILYPDLPTLLGDNSNNVTDQMDSTQMILYYLYDITILGFAICILLIGYNMNKYWHPITKEYRQDDDILIEEYQEDKQDDDTLIEEYQEDEQEESD